MIKQYRTDIDGLRTVAVIPVVIFHLGTSLFSGGFVGVDVFFVISGFLITQTLLGEQGAWRDALFDFYKRRIKRIFPALFALYLVVMLAACGLLMSDQATEVSRSIIASIFFVSNMLFYGQSGYFDGELDSNPLLHTWSLSVEEQFYIFFPLLIFFTRSWSATHRRQLIWALTLASFVAAQWMVSRNASAAFYLIPFRTWELSLGSLLAMGAIPAPRRQWQAEIGVAAGLALIAWSVFFYNKATTFPGASALVPCLGAGLVLLCGQRGTTWGGRLLSLPPMRFIGLISYSLYLWHWPIIVFYRQIDSRLDNVERLALLAAAIVAATLSWAFVEKPFRRSSRLTSRAVVARGTAAMAACGAGVLSLALLSNSLYPISAQARDVLAYGERTGRTEMMRTGSCFLTTQNRLSDYSVEKCLTAPHDKPRLLIIGDSHAAHLYYGLNHALPNMHVLQATAAGCKPLIHSRGDARCLALMQRVFSEYLPRLRPDMVVLSARWLDKDVPDVEQTVRLIRQAAPHVIVSGPIVEYDQALPRLLAKHIDQAEPLSIHRNGQVAVVDQQLATAMKQANIPYFSTYRSLCASDCRLWVKSGVPVQFDYGHLTQQGSIFIADLMARDIRPQLAAMPKAADMAGL
ncbi:acyltransferase [Sphingobium sp. JS3065]|uniref:acyltransferase family protein n=1 Tax=Sphingobium sp. JS3065 TaxID=2970925 RepID=UPI00226472BE|nr:acyltransferase family protein [Sphingobium sp. JS3065]UZW57780.1 acyltransferase [Sphingobium sp. JS3065]